ncbi:MAG: heme exporter protein CcmB [Chloroflexi bacterium]|nr:heme exporter protein CcmB [Chloroflexota bacterium]
MKTPFFQVVLAIVRKDLQAELRSRELVSSMLMFALLSVLVFSFALELDRLARQEAISGVLWVTVIFASVLGLNRSLAAERDAGNLDAMLLAPVERAAVFFGKLLGNFIFALTVGLLLLPLMAVLYNAPLLQGWLLLILFLGTLGFSTCGTLLAAMTVQTRTRESLLPIVLLPVALPVLLAAVNASTAILRAAPLNDWVTWPQILAAVDLIYMVLCYLLFSFVIEE